MFEGIDSSGKSTQIKLLEEKFKRNKIEFTTLREPGGNPVSEKIRDILLDKSLYISDSTETLLFLASRAQNTNDGIIKNVSITGGDPLDPIHLNSVLELIKVC